MNLYFELGLVGLMLTGRAGKLTAENNPVMVDLLRSIGLDYVFEGEATDTDRVKERMCSIVSAIESRLAYYDASELLVNTLVNQYLGELLADLQNGGRNPERNVAMQVCALGNKNSDHLSGAAVNDWIEFAHKGLRYFMEIYEGHEQPNIECMNANIRQMEYAERVLNIVDVFVTSRLGMVMGAEEFAPSQLEDLPEAPVVDFDEPEDCQRNDDCDCGCKFDHPLQLLQGMEDYLNGQNTFASNYLIGVASARNARMSAVEGTEGAILDGIKEMATKAWETISESFKAIKEWFTSSDEKDTNKATVDAAEANKKDLAAAKATTGDQINSVAKAGLVKLAAESDPSGAFSAIVGGLNSKADAATALDKLLGLLNKQSGYGAALGEAMNLAQQKLAELKTAASNVSGKDEANKEVVATTRKSTQEKIAAAKDSLKGLKEKVTAHKKLVSGIRKAAAGINSKIFPNEAADKPDEKAKKE